MIKRLFLLWACCLLLVGFAGWTGWHLWGILAGGGELTIHEASVTVLYVELALTAGVIAIAVVTTKLVWGFFSKHRCPICHTGIMVKDGDIVTFTEFERDIILEA